MEDKKEEKIEKKVEGEPQAKLEGKNQKQEIKQESEQDSNKEKQTGVNKNEKKEEQKETQKDKSKFKQVKPDKEKNETIKKENTAKKETNKKTEKVAKVKKESNKEKGKGKGIIARTIAVLIILFVIVALIYLAVPTPEKTINEMLKSMKEGNFEQLEQYVDYKDLANISALGTNDEEQMTEEEAQKEKLFYESLEWKINKVETKGEEATAEIQVTNKNFKTIFNNYIKKVIQKAFSGENTSDEEMEQYLLDEFKNESIDKITTTQTITLKKQDGKWKIQVNDNLRNAVYPGLTETMNEFSSSLAD